MALQSNCILSGFTIRTVSDWQKKELQGYPMSLMSPRNQSRCEDSLRALRAILIRTRLECLDFLVVRKIRELDLHNLGPDLSLLGFISPVTK